MGGQTLGPAMGILGIGIGYLAGGGTPIGIALGGAIGSMAGGIIGSFLHKPKPLIADLQTGNASYGNPIPILYGTARLGGTMIWQSQIRTTSSGIGKGGASGSQYHYHQSAAFAFCEGEAICRKIWLDGKLFWDASNPKQEYSKHTFLMRGYDGTEDQLPDPLIATWVALNVASAPGACPAYRGLAYLVCEGVDLANYGGRMPQVTAEWTRTGSRDYFRQSLSPWTVDVTAFHDPFAVGYNQTKTIDWAAQTVYTMGSDGTARGYSITTGEQFVSVAASTYAPTITPPVWAPGWTQPEFPITNGITVGEGSRYVYLWGSLLPQSMTYWLRAYDRNTLQPAGDFCYLSDEPYWLVSPAPGQVDYLRVYDIAGADGTKECLLGVGGYGNVFFIQMLGPEMQPAKWIPMHFENLSRYTCICSGDHDVLADGSEHVYLLQGSFWADGCYVYRVTITGADIIDQVLLGVLMPSTFGYTDGSDNAFIEPWGWYDSSDGTLIVSLRQDQNMPGDFLAKISPDKLIDGEDPVIWQNIVPGSGNVGGSTLQDARDVSLGTLVFGDGSHYNIVDTATGQYTSRSVSSPVLSGTVTQYVYSYDAQRQAMLVQGTVGGKVIPQIVYLNSVSAADVAVADIIVDLCAKVGITADMVDVTAVTATCVGYVVRDVRSAASAIADLCHTFQIDMVESDYLLKFIPRGQAAVATIQQAALAPLEASNMGSFWDEKPAQEQEMPLEIMLKYSDPNLDYQPGSTYAKRTSLPVPTMWSKRRSVVDLPVIVDAVSARHIAETLLYNMWAERTTYQAALGPQYLWLDPTDNVTVVLDGETLTVRVEQIQMGADFSLRLQLASEDISVYTPSSSPGPLIGVGPQTITPAALAQLLALNVPLLRDADATDGTKGRVYFAAGAVNPASFTAATVYRSTDTVTWPVEGAIAAGAAWGRARTVLGDTRTPFATDYLNTLTVSLNPGSTAPVSCSTLDLMNYANAALVGQEIIQYQTVTDNADGTYTLSTLLRGRRGTDWATSLHVANEMVILLDISTISGGLMDLSDLDRPEFWKLVDPSQTLGGVTAQTFTWEGYDLMPYAPTNVLGVYSGSPPDIILTWDRRTRIGGLLVDGSDTAPLSETSEQYDVEIMDGAAVKRTISTLTSPTTTYTNAQVLADWGGLPDTLQVRVYQRSSVVGRGFTKLWTLDLSGVTLAEEGVAP